MKELQRHLGLQGVIHGREHHTESATPDELGDLVPIVDENAGFQIFQPECPIFPGLMNTSVQ